MYLLAICTTYMFAVLPRPSAFNIMGVLFLPKVGMIIHPVSG